MHFPVSLCNSVYYRSDCEMNERSPQPSLLILRFYILLQFLKFHKHTRVRERLHYQNQPPNFTPHVDLFPIKFFFVR